MKTKIELNNIEELKKTSLQYASIYRNMEQLSLQMNKEIDKIKQKYEIKQEQYRNKQTTLKKSIQNFVEHHKDTIIGDTKRSIEFPNITLGFRRSSEISIPNSRKIDILKALKSMNKHDCIEVKETIKKTMLSQWNDQELIKIGVTRKEKDNFYIDVRIDEI